jgi:hypothetical protein
MNDFFIIATGTSPYSMQREETRTVSLKRYTTHTASYPSIPYFRQQMCLLCFRAP